MEKKKLVNYTRTICKNVEDVQLNMFVIKNKYCVFYEILRFKVFGLVKSFGLRFLYYRTVFTADDLRWTTSACYRLGYCHVLVDRVYTPNCEGTSPEISPMLNNGTYFLNNCRHWNLIFSQRGNWGCSDWYSDEFPCLPPTLAISTQTQSKLGGTVPLTRARPGGGYQPPPLRFFADSEKTAARSAAKFAIAVQPTIWHISKKRWPDDTKGHDSRSDLKVRFSKFDIVPKAHQWSELFETRSVQLGHRCLHFVYSNFWYRWP